MTHSWKTSDLWHVILLFWTCFLIWRNGNKLIRLLSWSKKTLYVKYIHGSEHTVCVQQMVTIINTVFKKERKLISSESTATLLLYNPKYELPEVLKIVAPPLVCITSYSCLCGSLETVKKPNNLCLPSIWNIAFL